MIISIEEAVKDLKELFGLNKEPSNSEDSEYKEDDRGHHFTVNERDIKSEKALQMLSDYFANKTIDNGDCLLHIGDSWFVFHIMNNE